MPRFLIVLLFALLSQQATAQSQGEVLRVGITEVPPFVIQEADGRWSGISIDLWQAIAEQAGYRYELQPKAFDQLLPGLEQDQLDVVVGALTMTAEREALVDFTHPFYRTGLAIGVPPAQQGSGWGAVRARSPGSSRAWCWAWARYCCWSARCSGCSSAGATASSSAAVR